MKQRRSTAKEMKRAVDQLKEWCAGRDLVALNIYGQFFHLAFAGHIAPTPKEGGFVFESPSSAVLSAFIPSIFTDFRVRGEGCSTSVIMKRKDGQISITKIDELRNLLTTLPLLTDRIQ